MASNDVKVNQIAIAAPDAAAGSRAPIALNVAVENTSASRRYANSTPRYYAYDAATRVLTLHLEEKAPALPPGLIMISDHPRTPKQVEVAPGGKATLQALIPSVIRKPATNGVGWVEEPIGPVDSVDIRVQHSADPLPAVGEHETGTEYRARALSGSETFSARVKAEPARPTSRK